MTAGNDIAKLVWPKSRLRLNLMAGEKEGWVFWKEGGAGRKIV